VSIIVPTRDRAELLERCANSVLLHTDYPALELLIVDNDSREPATAQLLRRLSQNSRVRIITCPGPFNYSALNNRATREAQGEVLLLLNNDIASIRPDWLREMVSHAMRLDVGAVGAKLLYPNEQVQHGGMVFQPEPVHQFRFADRLETGPGGELALARSVSIATGACLAMRRSVFVEAGGLDENLKVGYNDVDLCLRLGDRGYRIIWTPFAELFHFEGASRGYDDTPEKQATAASEFSYFRRRWGSLLEGDPFRNSNLTYHWDLVALSAPPSRKRPWLS
jgi:GT2 family glycosyltransferase